MGCVRQLIHHLVYYDPDPGYKTWDIEEEEVIFSDFHLPQQILAICFKAHQAFIVLVYVSLYKYTHVSCLPIYLSLYRTADNICSKTKEKFHCTKFIDYMVH
jgi:hypothetical protein